MVEKKVTDMKSVTLADVKAVDLKGEVKRVSTSSTSTSSSTESKNAKDVAKHDKTVEKNKEDILKHEYDELEKKWEEGDDDKEASVAKKILKDESKGPPEPIL